MVEGVKHAPFNSLEFCYDIHVILVFQLEQYYKYRCFKSYLLLSLTMKVEVVLYIKYTYFCLSNNCCIYNYFNSWWDLKVCKVENCKKRSN